MEAMGALGKKDGEGWVATWAGQGREGLPWQCRAGGEEGEPETEVTGQKRWGSWVSPRNGREQENPGILLGEGLGPGRWRSQTPSRRRAEGSCGYLGIFHKAGGVFSYGQGWEGQADGGGRVERCLACGWTGM